MPVRVDCPSCSAQLNIRDEHAGRAVKCPKCGNVIPPPADSAPPPLPVPPPLPPEPVPPPLPTPDAPRPLAKPASARPPRDRDDDDDDRPRRKPRRRNDDDDDRSRERPAKSSSGAGMVLGIVGIILLVCCGGAGGLGYYLYLQGKKVADAISTINLRVNRASYDRLTEAMTPAEVESILGPGRIANADDVDGAFGEANKGRAGEWKALAEQGRVALWRNGDEFLLCGFHPSATNGRLQLKTFQPKTGFNSAEHRFATDEQASKPDWGRKKEPLPPIEIQAWNLAKMFKDDPAEGNRNYKGRTLIVSGVVSDVSLQSDVVMVTLVNPPPATPPGLKIRFQMKSENARNAWRLTRGQAAKLRGVCDGSSALFVDFSAASIDSQETDPAIQVPAASFLGEFTKDGDAAAKKYEGKQVLLQFAVVVSAEGNTLFLAGSPLKPKLLIKATFPAEFRNQIAGFAAKPGGRVSVKGEFSTFTDGEISLNRCWIVP
jgi:predicted Zn finger-like uncharacterized protein